MTKITRFTLPPRKIKLFSSSLEFEIKKLIGCGGFSQVYEAIHKGTKKPYALKIIDFDRLGTLDQENIQKEIEGHQKFDHPNIVKLFDYFQEDKKVYLVLEFCQHGNLFDYLVHNPVLQEYHIQKITQQTIDSINHIHEKGYIMRDIKPENLLIDGEKNVKICDFGWTASLSDDIEYRKVKAGTFFYMSPESLLGQIQDKPSDIWSIGILLYELFHNKNPYNGLSVEEQLQNIYNKELIFDKTRIPIIAENLIRKILRFEPDKRPDIKIIREDPFLKQQLHFNPNFKNWNNEEYLLKDYFEGEKYFDKERIENTKNKNITDVIGKYNFNIKRNNSAHINVINNTNMIRNDNIKKFENHKKISSKYETAQSKNFLINTNKVIQNEENKVNEISQFLSDNNNNEISNNFKKYKNYSEKKEYTKSTNDIKIATPVRQTYDYYSKTDKNPEKKSKTINIYKFTNDEKKMGTEMQNEKLFVEKNEIGEKRDSLLIERLNPFENGQNDLQHNIYQKKSFDKEEKKNENFQNNFAQKYNEPVIRRDSKNFFNSFQNYQNLKNENDNIQKINNQTEYNFEVNKNISDDKTILKEDIFQNQKSSHSLPLTYKIKNTDSSLKISTKNILKINQNFDSDIFGKNQNENNEIMELNGGQIKIEYLSEKKDFKLNEQNKFKPKIIDSSTKKISFDNLKTNELFKIDSEKDNNNNNRIPPINEKKKISHPLKTRAKKKISIDVFSKKILN